MPLAQADRDPSRVPQQCKMRRLTTVCVHPILSLALASIRIDPLGFFQRAAARGRCILRGLTQTGRAVGFLDRSA